MKECAAIHSCITVYEKCQPDEQTVAIDAFNDARTCITHTPTYNKHCGKNTDRVHFYSWKGPVRLLVIPVSLPSRQG